MATQTVYEIEEFAIPKDTCREKVDIERVIKNHASETVDYFLYEGILTLLIEKTYTI